MAAISMVRKMAMVKKCGRSSQRMARLSHRSGPGWSGDGALERARVANLQDEGDEPAGAPGIGLVLRVRAAQDPLREIGAGQLRAEKHGEDHRVQADDGRQHEAEAGEDLSQVDRVPSQPVRTAGHQAPRLGDRSEEHTSELQSHVNLVCRLLLEKKKKK